MPVSPYAIREMAAKAVKLLPDRFPADHHTAFREQIFNIRSVKRKAMVDSDGAGDELSCKTKALKARHS